MSYYGYYDGPNPVVTIVLFLVAVVGGICAYFMFVKSKNRPANPFLEKLKEFLSFKTLIIEDLLKATYVIFALFFTLYSLQILFSNFIEGIMMFVLMNVFVRLVYEGSLLILMIWRNTSDINAKLSYLKVENVAAKENKEENK